jgi:hypothetical protein
MKPAFRNALAAGKCAKFGVTIETKSIRSPAGSLASASAIASLSTVDVSYKGLNEPRLAHQPQRRFEQVLSSS